MKAAMSSISVFCVSRVTSSLRLSWCSSHGGKKAVNGKKTSPLRIIFSHSAEACEIARCRIRLTRNKDKAYYTYTLCVSIVLSADGSVVVEKRFRGEMRTVGDSGGSLIWTSSSFFFFVFSFCSALPFFFFASSPRIGAASPCALSIVSLYQLGCVLSSLKCTFFNQSNMFDTTSRLFPEIFEFISSFPTCSFSVPLLFFSPVMSRSPNGRVRLQRRT